MSMTLLNLQVPDTWCGELHIKCEIRFALIFIYFVD